MIKTYRMNRFAEIEGRQGAWQVYNLVTGLAHGHSHTTFESAREAANHLAIHYKALERGR